MRLQLTLPLVIAILLASICAAAELPLMPWPSQVSTGPGSLLIDSHFAVSLTGPGATDLRVKRSASRLEERLFRQTGIPQAPGPAPAKASLQIVVEHPKPGIQQYNDDETYHLLITAEKATLTAKEPLGALRGMETFLQLIRASENGFSAPSADITDQPRFPWRGLSLDVSRHFLPVPAIRRTLDGMAAVKLNVLHWHLSDDQGFRAESKLHPLLQNKGSDGLFYTQTELRAVVEYARERGIRVVPEFDIPGHATSWFAGYPQLASGAGPYEIVREPGILLATMDPTKDSTYKFLDAFIGEMAAIFPDAFFHIGGDEVSPKGEWTNNPHITAFMRRNHLKDLAALQAEFNRRVQKIVATHGKRMEGWDEILDPDLPKSIVIQSWRGPKSLAEAAHHGYSGILSSGYYLDLMQPAAQHYAVDPMKGETEALTAEEKKRILGGEAAMWEELATMENIDAKLWPRLAAIAERLWSPETVTDVDSMYRRLEATSRWLELQGIEHRSQPLFMLQRLAGAADIETLAKFAAILEPVKGYARHRNHKYSSLEPYNRLVDSLAPESDAGREFNQTKDRDILRARLTEWRANAEAVLPVLRATTLLSENVPLAERVVELCRRGLDALDSRLAATPFPEPDNKSEILIAFEPGVRRLTGAAAP